ncbi:MAG: UDP-N-acetylmuramoyl-L-alanine--D-glutamate ligase [Oscillospiraceae bacterium]|nr:UDP-N-acetylmuramoyl-L-alanine--D-glutamate ligase [Oscillospiraceae bacterium]
MTLEAYFEKFRGKRVAVLGLGVSNRPLLRLLTAHGAKVIGCDKTARSALDAEVLAFEAMGVELHLGEAYLQNLSCDVAFRTPGMLPNMPELRELAESGVQITSEMEAFFAVCPCRIIGVTGSDGKTTTATLIAKILEHAGHSVHLGGNIGTPLLEMTDTMERSDWVVVELSSFQLMDMHHSGCIAVVTNVAPNHLDMHRDMDEYVQAKKNCFLYQNDSDTLVLNYDNEITRSFAAEARGTVKFFSRESAQGVHLQDGVVYRGETPILRQDEILLPGIHNVENYMAAIAALAGLASDADIRAVAQSFGGVEHRIELVRVRGGVSYYNDSIASSPSRTIAGLRSFSQKVILIAGGYDKHISYDVLGPEVVAHVKLLVATGATGGKIVQAVKAAADYREGMPEIVEKDDFHEAVLAAAKAAQPGDIVLLSPASAAFDRFKNFMVRGAAFKALVREL